jgi:hypothetical protein
MERRLESITKKQSVKRRPRISGIRSLPIGAVGVWYASQFDSIRRAIPNSAILSSLQSNNIVRFPKRNFSDTDLWVAGNQTVTEGIDAGDGTTDASRIQGTGTGGVIAVSGNSINLPSGTYTLGIKIRVHGGGANQNFTMSFPNVPGTPVTQTATASYQVIALVGTTPGGSENPIFLRGVGSTPFDFDVAGVCLLSGNKTAQDCSNELSLPFAGHMILGKNLYEGPSVSSGKLNLENGDTISFGAIQFAADISISTYTIVALVQRDGSLAAGASATLLAALTSNGGSSKFQSAFSSGDTGTNADFSITLNGGALADRFSVPMAYNLRGEMCALTSSWDGTYQTIWFNGSRVLINPMTGIAPNPDSVSTSNPVVPIFLKDLYAGKNSGVTPTGGFSLGALAFYNRALSPIEMRQCEAALRSRTSVSAPPQGRILIFEGDSNTNKSVTGGVYSYAGRVGNQLNKQYTIFDYALVGSQIFNNHGTSGNNDLGHRASSIDGMLITNNANYLFTLSINIGTNCFADIPTRVYSDLATYVAARRAAGWNRIIIWTVAPSNDPSTSNGYTYNNWRDEYNGYIKANTIGADGIVDTTSDPHIGPNSAVTSDSIYFLSEGVRPDRYHYANAGHVICSQLFSSVLNGLDA